MTCKVFGSFDDAVFVRTCQILRKKHGLVNWIFIWLEIIITIVIIIIMIIIITIKYRGASKTWQQLMRLIHHLSWWIVVDPAASVPC